MREKTLDIGGHAYKIKGMNNEKGESGKGFLLGKHDVKKCEIYLDKEMTYLARRYYGRDQNAQITVDGRQVHVTN